MISTLRPNETSIGHGLLAVALISGAILVLPGLATSPLGIDEHVSYWIAGAENPGTLWHRSLNYAATPPLSSIVQRGFLGIGGKSELMLRLPSALGFLVAIVFTFLFARDLLGPLPAGLAAQFLVWHPDLIDRMRQARPYGMTVALAALLLWLTERWRRAPGDVRLMLAWTLAATALVWTHYLNIPLIGLLLAWLGGFPLTRSESRRRWLLLLAAVGLFTASLFPLLFPLMRLQEWSAMLNYRAAPPELWQGIGPLWWLTLPVGFSAAWLLTRLLPGDTIAIPLHRNLAVLLALGCLPIVVFAAIPHGSLSTLAEPRYRLVYSPATAVLIAACLMNHRKLLATLLASAIGIAGAWWIQGERPWVSRELTVPAATDWTTLTQRLQQEGTPDSPLFVYSGLIESRLVPLMFADNLFHDYVACRAGRFIVETPHPRLALPWSWNRNQPLPTFYETALQQARDRGITTAWLIAGLDTDLGRDAVERFIQSMTDRRYRVTERITTPNAILIRFERSANPS